MFMLSPVHRDKSTSTSPGLSGHLVVDSGKGSMIELSPDKDPAMELLATLSTTPAPLNLLREDFCLRDNVKLIGLIDRLRFDGHSIAINKVNHEGRLTKGASFASAAAARKGNKAAEEYWRTTYETA